jgi:hypothetical protein
MKTEDLIQTAAPTAAKTISAANNKVQTAQASAAQAEAEASAAIDSAIALLDRRAGLLLDLEQLQAMQAECTPEVIAAIQQKATLDLLDYRTAGNACADGIGRFRRQCTLLHEAQVIAAGIPGALEVKRAELAQVENELKAIKGIDLTKLSLALVEDSKLQPNAERYHHAMAGRLAWK